MGPGTCLPVLAPVTGRVLQRCIDRVGTQVRSAFASISASLADTSRATAFRDIHDLVKNGLLLAEGTGRGNTLRPGAARLGMEAD